MTLLHSFLLGIIQGLTEFIPVSSTAHLLIGQTLFGIPSDGKIFSFQVIIQLGTVFALLLFFWRDFWNIIQSFTLGIRNRRPFENHDSRLGWLVVIATVPALVVGYVVKDFVQVLFGNAALQAGIRLMMSAAMLTAVEFFGQRQRKLESATWVDALTVGLFQVLAVFPGASRSGSTIAGGMARGFDRPSAARFAFLMSAPILLAAGAYEMLQVLEMPDTRAFLPYLATGFLAAAVVGWLSIRWLMAYLHRHSLYIFAVYCAVVGVIVLLLQLR